MLRPPLWWRCVQGVYAVPCFCFQLFRSGTWAFWSLCILWSIICPDCAGTQLFLVPYSLFFFFLYFVAGGDICPGAGTAAKGPRSQVPPCLKANFPENSLPAISYQSAFRTVRWLASRSLPSG